MLIGESAHARFHHPYQHTAVDIFDCHFEPSLYQGAFAKSLPRAPPSNSAMHAVSYACIDRSKTLGSV